MKQPKHTGSGISPRASSKAEKYRDGRPGIGLPYLAKLFNSVFASSDHTLMKLIFASLTKSSWKRYETSVKTFARFCKSENVEFSFPIPSNVKINFVVWLSEKRNLSCSTLKAYLSALDHLATMLGQGGTRWFEDDRMKLVLRGVKNLERGGAVRVRKSRAIRVSDLLKIRKRLARASWGLGSRQSFWTCCLIAFFGSCRISELLGEFAVLFGSKSAFCWKNVVWVDENHVQIEFRIPKTNRNTEKVDLFSFPNKKLCPVRALKNLEISQKQTGLWAPDLPVFRLTSGACLEKSKFAKILKNLLKSENLENLDLRSFRSGIPSLLERNPELANDSHIKIWGRWRGNSYQTYMKGGNLGKKWIFKKIVAALLNEI